MGDVGDDFRWRTALRNAVREHFGVRCPKCIEEQPRRTPTLLLPGHWCKVHKPRYVDPRPHCTWFDLIDELPADKVPDIPD